VKSNLKIPGMPSSAAYSCKLIRIRAALLAMEVFIKSIKNFKRIFHQRRRVRAQRLVHYSVCTFIQALGRYSLCYSLTSQQNYIQTKTVLFYLVLKSARSKPINFASFLFLRCRTESVESFHLLHSLGAASNYLQYLAFLVHLFTFHA
jgi:hypothetical protein